MVGRRARVCERAGRLVWGGVVRLVGRRARVRERAGGDRRAKVSQLCAESLGTGVMRRETSGASGTVQR